LPRRIEQSVQVAIDHGMHPQILNCVAAFDYRVPGILETFVEHFRRAIGSPGKQISRGLEHGNQPLKTLQKRVVQIAGDTQALVHAAFQIRAELARDPMQTQPV
jgi:hypothetical protein